MVVTSCLRAYLSSSICAISFELDSMRSFPCCILFSSSSLLCCSRMSIALYWKTRFWLMLSWVAYSLSARMRVLSILLFNSCASFNCLARRSLNLLSRASANLGYCPDAGTPRMPSRATSLWMTLSYCTSILARSSLSLSIWTTIGLINSVTFNFAFVSSMNRSSSLPPRFSQSSSGSLSNSLSKYLFPAIWYFSNLLSLGLSWGYWTLLAAFLAPAFVDAVFFSRPLWLELSAAWLPGVLPSSLVTYIGDIVSWTACRFEGFCCSLASCAVCPTLGSALFSFVLWDGYFTDEDIECISKS